MTAPMIDPALLAMFDVVWAKDPEDLSGTFRVSEQAAQSSRIYTYQFQGRALWRLRFEQPILTLATRGAGSILASYADSSSAPTSPSMATKKGWRSVGRCPRWIEFADDLAVQRRSAFGRKPNFRCWRIPLKKSSLPRV